MLKVVLWVADGMRQVATLTLVDVEPQDATLADVRQFYAYPFTSLEAGTGNRGLGRLVKSRFIDVHCFHGLVRLGYAIEALPAITSMDSRRVYSFIVAQYVSSISRSGQLSHT